MSVALISCDESTVYVARQGNINTNNNTTASTPIVANLDLQALGELVTQSNDAKEIETELNKPGSINNINLSGDTTKGVDYIKVTEYGDNGTKGFSFTVDMPNGEKQEIATVEVQKGNNNQASMNINGNNDIYGSGASYNSNYSFSDMAILSYLFMPHPYYISPWSYGYYPSYYRPYRCMSYGMYHSRMNPYTSSSRITRTTTRTSTIKSPNSSFHSSTVSSRNNRSSLSNSTHSQRSFSSTSSSASRPSTSGFSRSSSSSSGRSSSSSRSSFGGSSRSSGGSHSSGGRRSDILFKTNIIPLNNSLDKITTLNGYTYDWKVKEFPNEKFDKIKQIGLIAQEVEKVYPMIVNTRPDGFKQVDYEMLIPVLVEAVKELKTTNTKQDSLIKVLLSERISINVKK